MQPPFKEWRGEEQGKVIVYSTLLDVRLSRLKTTGIGNRKNQSLVLKLNNFINWGGFFLPICASTSLYIK
jgi:hypothetical protein